MPAEKALALVLRVIEFSETSSVVTLFTREFGKLSGLAKGARRPKGSFDAALDLLCRCRVVFLPKSSGALDLLTEAKLERRFRCADLPRLYAGYYVAELLAELSDDHDPHPELFDAADAALRDLEAQGHAPAAVLRFELVALRLLGHMPSLDSCVECGSPVESSGRVAFGLAAGGVLCGNCRPGRRNVVSLSGGVVRALAEFAEAEGDAWKRIELDKRNWGELRGAMNQYVTHLIGRPPRLHPYLRSFPGT